MLRLIVTPSPTPGHFVACLETTGELIVQSHQPLVDGARKLLAKGYDPAEPLTMRHAGKAYDSFVPQPISEWARWTYVMRDRGPSVMAARWMPIADTAIARKQGKGRAGGTSPHQVHETPVALDPAS